jgi:uncharacterized protein YndB with AHSA1/START domain
MSLSLIIRRVVRASAERCFEAWTTPSQLRAWWGPRGVKCSEASVDLRVGGRYRIGNELPNGAIVIIEGAFEVIEPPSKLVYTWIVDGGPEERVTVRFEKQNGATEVIIVHDGIRDEPTQKTHEQGWLGCLDGLEAHL